ncbi:hypothetical protein [Desulfacinum hydrothermale]|nr:hypothetical protein [Desulfacinum hydrothermale]
MARRFHVIRGGRGGRGQGGGLRPLVLFRAYSIGELQREELTYYNVRFNWYRLDRTEPVAPWEHLVADFYSLDERLQKKAREEVLRYLTEEEVWELRLYLREHHGLEVIAEEVSLPILSPRGPFWGGEKTVFHFLELSERPDYSLPFRVWGYYSLAGCLCTPTLEAGCRFLEKALAHLKVKKAVGRKDLEGVVKAIYLQEGLYVRRRGPEDAD